MTEGAQAHRLADLWDDAAASQMSESQQLLYRSNLLGSDRRITNYGGGNTSAKIMDSDPLTGEPVEVLWVKGSGGDLGSMDIQGFATLYMERLQALKKLYRGVAFEDEMAGLLPHCTFALNPRAASIDTPLHAFVPRAHVDHVHPDAIIAIAAAKNSRALTREILGKDIGWLAWRRPGFELGLQLEAFCREHPDAKGVVLQSHGLFTWGDDARSCYACTLGVISRAMGWLAARMAGVAPFGGPRHPGLAGSARRAAAVRLMPALRGMISDGRHVTGHFNDSEAVLEFVNSSDLGKLAPQGTSCPDHFLRTKIRPLIVDFDPAADDRDAALAALSDQIAAYRAQYSAFYERCHAPDSPPMRDPNAVVYLVPGIGMMTFAADKATARIAGEFYTNAINVMRGASAVDEYTGLDEQDAFNIEYWQLEEAKLQRMPPPRALAGRVALVTGGAGGIGAACAARFLADGACVVLADIDGVALEDVVQRLKARFCDDVVHGVEMDVTDETGVRDAFAAAVLAFGGIDILVSNAGIASAAPVGETTLELWNRNMGVLSTGYFLVSREAFRVFGAQKSGGSIVFVGSKNALAASANASAYCTAKASVLHLARCLALEGAPCGVRVNVVNPDAVLKGSRIWQGEWLEQRAATYGTDAENLAEMYRRRSMLKRHVLPEDIAEAVCFLAGDLAGKSTGNILNVDAGNVQAFTR